MHIAMNAWKARAAITPPTSGLDSAREALEKALEAWKDDMADPAHAPGDWSEQVCIERVRTALSDMKGKP
jgi:hypothetical protein